MSKMAEEKETPQTEATEERQTEVPAGAPSGPSEVSHPKQSICSVCGKTVVPVPVETPTGWRYKCPECKKFMKPLSPKDVKERAAADAKIAPIEVEMMNRVKELLKKHLPRVYGIPPKHAAARITAIIDTLTPVIATNPFNLHSHIKRYASGADDRHLESIIATIFAQLEAEGYKPSSVSAPYIPAYGQQGYPGRTGAYCPTYPPTYPPSYPPQGYPGQPAGYPQPPEPMKIIVDGQEITTDLKGHMAWKGYLADQKKEKAEEDERKEQAKRRREVHDLAVQKFQEEIKKIAEGGGKKADEDVVEVPFGETKIKVPVSIAHLYLNKGPSTELTKMQEKITKQDEKLEKMKEDAHTKEIDGLKGIVVDLADKIDKRPTVFEEMEAMDNYAERRGYSRTGKTVIDVVDTGLGNLDHRAQELLRKMQGGKEEFKPDITRTPDARKEKAGEIQKRLEKKEDILTAEDELVRAASKMG